LDLLRKCGPISRTDIAKKSGLSLTTVSSGVYELIVEGIAREVGQGLSNGGRKPRLVEFFPDSKFIIGISITNSLIKIAELNLEAIVQKKKEFIVRKQRGDSFIAYVMDSNKLF
jgi:hypothetical protein